VTVTEESALTSSAVWACVKVLAESVAVLPLITYRRNGDGGKSRAVDHPLYKLLKDSPNPEMTAFEFRSTLTGHVAAWGNGYAEIAWGRSGYPVALWPLLPNKMENVSRVNGQLMYDYRMPDGSLKTFNGQQIHHVRGLSGNGIVGYSPIRQAMQAIGLALATEEFGARFFGNGARPGVILKHPGRLSSEAVGRLREGWNSAHEGLSNAHRVRILEEGMDVETVGIPPEEAQFLQTRQFQIAEIARMYRIPAHMVGDLSRSTNNNIEHQSIEFVVQTLMPWLRNFEQAMQRDLMTPRDRDGFFVEHLVDGLMRGDTASRYAAHQTGRQAGFLSVNDIRKMENMDPIEGGDTYLEPLNMVAVGSQGADDGQGQADGQAGRSLRILGGQGIEERAQRAAGDRRKLYRAQEPVLRDVAARLVRREVNDVRRAVQKYLVRAKDTAGFLLWLGEFYTEHAGFVAQNMGPVLESMAQLVMDAVADEVPGRIDRADVLAKAVEYAQNMGLRWSLSSRGQLEKLVSEAKDANADPVEPIEERLTGWEETQADKNGRREAVRGVNALAKFAYVAAGVTALRWVSSGEDCPYCEAMNGRTVGVEQNFFQGGESFEPEGAKAPLLVRGAVSHPPVHDGCLIGDSRVLARSGVLATSKRWFDGDVIIIRTASGHELTCTPNHPILTEGGWVAAGLLYVGGHVISDGGREWRRGGNGDNQDVPSRIEDVVETFGRGAQVITTPMPVTAKHFHGDGVGSKVAIVRTNGLLMNDFNPPVCEHCGQSAFITGDAGAVGLTGLGSETALGVGLGASGGGKVGGGGLGFSLGGGHLGGADETGGAVAAGGDVVLDKVATDNRSGHTQFQGQGILGLPSEVFTDEIVSVQRDAFHGDVFNLQTGLGWYVANGIVTHNCDCAIVAG